MGQPVDITGQKFNMLTAIKPTDKRNRGCRKNQESGRRNVA